MAPDRKDDQANAREILRRHWGHPDFRPGQARILRAVLCGRDTLGVLPTGGGKSICYQVPALLSEGMTLVVTPLVSLMEDQVAALTARGIAAACIHGAMPGRAVDQCWTDAEFGRYRLLYVAPERLRSAMFQARAERLRVTRLAVDEAHCISEWGPHFRPAYREIREARERLGSPPVLALTATATPAVRADIIEQLALRNPEIVVTGFDRPNLIWSVFRTDNKREKVLEVLERVEGPAIVYAATRAGVDSWHEALETAGIASLPYHAGLPDAARQQAQGAWMDDRVRVIVATNAFGMGIDKPDVRVVLHADLPGSLEGYFQEAGRAGRDGRKAYAVLLWNEADRRQREALLEDSHPLAKDLRAVYDAAMNLGQVPVAGMPEGPLVLNMEGIRKLTGLRPGRIRTAVELLDRMEVWKVLPARPHKGMIHFNGRPGDVRRMVAKLEGKALAGFVEGLIRTIHAEAFNTWWDVDLIELGRHLGLKRERLLAGLRFLEQRGVLQFQSSDEMMRVLPADHRSAVLPLDDAAIRWARRRAQRQLADVLRYAQSVTCRRRYLREYFGEQAPARCGSCDVCLGRHRPRAITPEDEPVLRHLLVEADKVPQYSDWTLPAGLPDHRVEALLDWLVHEGYLGVSDPLAPAFALTEKARAWLEHGARQPG